MPSESARPRTPTDHWRRLLVAVCIAQATAIIGFDFTVPFIPLYLQHDLGIHGLGQTALWAGLIGFGPAIPATIFGPMWGRLADRFGYRSMLLRAMGSAALLLMLMGLAPSPAVLLVLRMIQGALTGTVFSAQALVAASVPERETARSMGLLQMSIFAGATIGPVGGGAVAQTVGFRPTFAAAGILLASAAVIVFVFVHEPGRNMEAVTGAQAPRTPVLTVLFIPAFAAALVMTLVVQLAGTALFPVIPLFVQDLLHTSHGVATATGWVMAASGVSAALGSYVAGKAQRRVGLRPALVVCLVLSALLLVPQGLVGTYVEFIMTRSLAAFAFGGLFGLVGALAATSSPSDAKGTAFGLLGAASSLGFGGGPLLGGALAATIGIRPLFFLSAGVLAMLPVLLGLTRIALGAAGAWRSHPSLRHLTARGK